MEILYFVIIGIVAGWLASMLMGEGGYGLIGDLIIGLIGAILGGFLFGLLKIGPDGSTIGQIVTATVGAIVFIFILRQISKKK